MLTDPLPTPSPLRPPPPERLPRLSHSQDAGWDPETRCSTAISQELRVAVANSFLPSGSFTRLPCSGRPPPSGWEAWPGGSKKDPVPSRTWWRRAPSRPRPAAGIPTMPSPLCHHRGLPSPELGNLRENQVGGTGLHRKQAIAAGEPTFPPHRGFGSLALRAGNPGCAPPTTVTCRPPALG